MRETGEINDVQLFGGILMEPTTVVIENEVYVLAGIMALMSVWFAVNKFIASIREPLKDKFEHLREKVEQQEKALNDFEIQILKENVTVKDFESYKNSNENVLNKFKEENAKQHDELKDIIMKMNERLGKIETEIARIGTHGCEPAKRGDETPERHL